MLKKTVSPIVVVQKSVPNSLRNALSSFRLRKTVSPTGPRLGGSLHGTAKQCPQLPARRCRTVSPTPFRSILRIAFVWVLFSIGPLQAQMVVDVDQHSSPRRELLDLSHYGEGTDIGSVLSVWGIRVTGPGSRTVHRILHEHLSPPLNVLPAPAYADVFSNEPADESEDSSHRPLVFHSGQGSSTSSTRTENPSPSTS